MNALSVRRPTRRLTWLIIVGALATAATGLGVTLAAVRSPRDVQADLESRVAQLEGRMPTGGSAGVPRLTGAGNQASSSLLDRISALEVQVAELRGDQSGGGNWHEMAASHNPELRRRSIRGLRDLAKSDAEARRALTVLLHDADARVRRSAVGALGDTDDPSWLTEVTALLSDAERGVRGRAARTAGELARLSNDHADRTRTAQALQGLLGDGDVDVRRDAVRALAEFGGKEAVPTLVRVLGDANFEVQGRAIEALGNNGDASVIGPLQQAYGDGSGPNALAAAVALKKLGDPSAFAKEAARLRSLVEREGPSGERREALALLAEHAPEQSRGLLEQALRDPSERVRREAQRLLDKARR
ncbi:MAG TPA: HEAT repeat domain-containing protein [Polyangia bacterium]